MRVMVLGAGRVGAAMVRDLAAHVDLEVSVADLSAAALEGFPAQVHTERADLSNSSEIVRLAKNQDLIVGAVPGPMGFATARAVLEAGTALVDISFFEQDAFELDELALEQGVPALVDCGVAPGASNLILGHLEQRLERIDSFTCYVGGLPRMRRQPFEYKAPFSPIDVLAEYTRPVRLRENGRDITRPALGRSELLDFPPVGTLEAFETDGLRTLLRTSKAPNLIEKTLRYPGHRRLMEILRDSGFLSADLVTLSSGAEVQPLELTAHLLFPRWQLEPGEEEMTLMRVSVEGVEDGRAVRHSFDLFDRTDSKTGTSSMARTTGYTATAIVRLLAEGLYSRPGIAPAEKIGRDAACFEKVMSYLAERGVVFERRLEHLAPSAEGDAQS